MFFIIFFVYFKTLKSKILNEIILNVFSVNDVTISGHSFVDDPELNDDTNSGFIEPVATLGLAVRYSPAVRKCCNVK